MADHADEARQETVFIYSTPMRTILQVSGYPSKGGLIQPRIHGFDRYLVHLWRLWCTPCY